jgi:hypothetical protein
MHAYSTFPDLEYLDLHYATLAADEFLSVEHAKLHSLSLPKTGISAVLVKRLVCEMKAFPNLEHLEINCSDWTSADVAAVIGCPEVELISLHLSGEAVNDAGLTHVLGTHAARSCQ